MAYDEGTAQALRKALTRAKTSPVEKKMFGGLCFMVEGHMACGVVGREAMFRVGPESYEEALARPHARPMDFTGKPLTGMVYVGGPGLVGAALTGWVQTAVQFARSMPAKKPRKTMPTPAPKKAATKKDVTKKASATSITSVATPAAKRAAKKASSKGAAPKPAAKKSSQPASGAFAGFPDATFRFLRGLEKDNSKAYFDRERANYDEAYVAPAMAFVTALGPQLQKLDPNIDFEPRINGSIFRIQRDTRFSKDKTPYKTHLDLWFWSGDRRGWNASGFFFRMYADRMILGAGMHRFEKQALETYRAAAAQSASGRALLDAMKKVRAAGPYEVGGPERKTLPRGIELPEGDPRRPLLLLEGLTATLEAKLPPAARSASFVEHCLGHFKAALPLHRWISANIK